MTTDFWRGRRVFLTGHTGFKGTWLCRWLAAHGAQVTGYALPPPSSPNLFEATNAAAGMTSVIGDIKDLPALRSALEASRAEVVFHMAAQPLVRLSYVEPVDTYATNVMGTVHLLDAVRTTPGVRVVVVISSDKCYENREWHWPYRENEPMGGKDPYSSSKGCTELVTWAYRASFFPGTDTARVASARAGNVIGGGDWADDRLVPDFMRAFAAGRRADVRYPDAARPWQFVLDPLHGYLLLAEALWRDAAFADAWNFGPQGSQPVRYIADRLAASWGAGASWARTGGEQPPEAMALQVDSSRARARLGWTPRVPLDTAIDWIVEFHKAWGADASSAVGVMDRQIERFDALSSTIC